MDILSLDFINSLRHDYLNGQGAEDRFAQQAWRQTFLTRYELDVSEPLSADTLKKMQDFRAWLRQALENVVARGELSVKDVEIANSYLLKVSVSREARANGNGNFEIICVPFTKDWEWFQSEVVQSFFAMLSNVDKTQLKICSNPNCRWIYYDDTKNHSQNWCDNTCANLMRVRRSRARQKLDQ
ncbi:MAG: CGNR zinc finger domain-containing protein [Candidatus Saccharibacteria bacterium]